MAPDALAAAPGHENTGSRSPAGLVEVTARARSLVSARLDEIDAGLWAAVGEGETGSAHLEAARLAAHTIAGSAGTLGNASASAIAGRIERHLEAASLADPSALATAGRLLRDLRQSLADEAAWTVPPVPGWRRMVIAHPEHHAAEGIAQTATARGWSPRVAADVDDARDLVRAEAPEVVVLAVGAPADGWFDVVRTARQHGSAVIVLVTGDESPEDFEQARHRADGLVRRSAEPEHIVDAAVYASDMRTSGPPRVLAVVEDPATLHRLRDYFEGTPFDLTTVQDRRRLREAVRAGDVDVVLVDADTRDGRAAEVYRQLAGVSGWPGVPLLALLARPTRAAIDAALAAGAADYLPTPLVGTAPMNRIATTVELARLRRRVIEGDTPTTGAPATTDVFIVEDDESLVSLLEQALETRGLRSEHESDGLVALERLIGPDPLIARVILLDVTLPGLDGQEILRRIQHAGVLSRSRVIMLTAATDDADVRTAMQAGAFDYVPKPFTLPVLTHRLRRALDTPP